MDIAECWAPNHQNAHKFPIQLSSDSWLQLSILSSDLGVKNGTGEVPHVIQILSSYPHIYELHVHYPIWKLPKTRQFSPHLAELNLEYNCLEEDPMPTLEKLPNLKILCLLGSYMPFLQKDMVCSERGFPLLQYLFPCT